MSHLYTTQDDQTHATQAHPPSERNPILESVEFQRLVKQRRLFSWSMTLLMLVVYFGFILSLALAPQRLAMRVSEGKPMTWGIPLGFGMLAFTFVLVAVYVWLTTLCYDPKIKAIIRSFEQ